MRVIVAEDDIISRKALVASIEDLGYEVVETQNGEEAWQTLSFPKSEKPAGIEKNDIHLAILDWQMPRMNGLELCRKIREQSLIHKQRYIYVILLTGRDSQEDIIQGLSAGADDYMLKPFDPLELKVRLKNGERLIQVKEKKSTFIHVDEITGIWNPQKILDFLAEEIERGCRLKMPVGVVLIEIDQFPQLLENLEQNEIHSLLRRLASQFKDTMRKYDKIGIYTRNQFLGVFPNCRKDHISHIGERLRRVADQAAAVGRQHITSSVGCTSSDLFPNCKDSDLVESSKKALSAAKKKGGNTVSYADPGQN